MAGFMPPEERRKQLDFLVSGTNYLGLAHALPLDAVPTLDNISEVITGGYQRVAVTWNSALVNGNSVRVTNALGTTLGPVTEDMPGASYAFLTDAQTGEIGDIKYVWELSAPVGALANKPIFVPAEALIIE